MPHWRSLRYGPQVRQPTCCSRASIKRSRSAVMAVRLRVAVSASRLAQLCRADARAGLDGGLGCVAGASTSSRDAESGAAAHRLRPRRARLCHSRRPLLHPGTARPHRRRRVRRRGRPRRGPVDGLHSQPAASTPSATRSAVASSGPATWRRRLSTACCAGTVAPARSTAQRRRPARRQTAGVRDSAGAAARRGRRGPASRPGPAGGGRPTTGSGQRCSRSTDHSTNTTSTRSRCAAWTPAHASFERASVFFPNTTWAGHCNGFAAAALLEPEPLEPVTALGVTFSVADLKGLLVDYHFGDAAAWTFGDDEPGSQSRRNFTPCCWTGSRAPTRASS